MSAASSFLAHLISIQCVDRKTMEDAGICPDTAKRMERDPVATFQHNMTIGERERFWPLVEAYLESKREKAREWLGGM